MGKDASVIVIGGGIAGLAAACQLADAGLRTLVLEKRPFLGGRAYSYVDGRSDLEVDNGQHVFLRCCDQYIAFLKRLGVYDRTYLQPSLRVRVIDKLNGVSVLRASPRLPPPFHLLPSFLRYRSLSSWERLLAGYALLRIHYLDRRNCTDIDDISFGDWLRANYQGRNAIRNFWNLIILPTLNDDVERVSADLALMVLQEGFLHSREGAGIGYARVGLSRLIGQAAADYLRKRGSEVRVNQAASGISAEDGQIQGAWVNGALLEADYYLLAVPWDGLLELLPSPLTTDPFFARLSQLQASPIVNVHLWYDRPVVGIDFAAFLNTPMQWLFNKSRLWGQEEARGQYLDISLSGAYDFVDMPGQDLVHLFSREISAFFPAARTATPTSSLVVKQPNATFAARPGAARLRAGQRTPVPNLFLAGDWTDTGWPATMESAVRSGVLAAQAIIESEMKGGDSLSTTLASKRLQA